MPLVLSLMQPGSDSSLAVKAECLELLNHLACLQYCLVIFVEKVQSTEYRV